MEHLVQIISHILANAIRSEPVRNALHQVLVEATTPTTSTAGLLDMKQLCKEFGISRATGNRLAREPGAPRHHVGGRLRFDLNEFRNWLAARGRKAAKVPPPSDEVIDVADLARRAGFHINGGAQ